MALDETRDRLLEAAGSEFAAHGFEGATVRAICDRAGVNLAAVNYHFGDKERLYEAVVMRAHEARPRFDPGPAGEAAGEALGRFVHHFLREVVFGPKDPWHQAIVMREIARPSAVAERLVREAFRPRFEALRAILRRLAPGADDRRLDALGFSVIGQCLHYKLGAVVTERVVGAAAFAALDLDYLVDHVTRFTLAALGAGEPMNGQDPRGGDGR